MKVFRVNAAATDHICGITIIQALQKYFQQTSMSLNEFAKEDDIIEIPKDQWHTIRFHHEDMGEMSIEDYMQTDNQAGLICSTEY